MKSLRGFRKRFMGIGLRSIIDVEGSKTYRSIRQELPTSRQMSVNEMMMETTRTMARVPLPPVSSNESEPPRCL